MAKKNKREKDIKPREFVEALNYPSKELRSLAMQPVSVPADPLVTNYSAFAGRKVNQKNFSYSLFFTAFDVRDYDKIMEDFIDIFFPLNIKKVYLETYRDGFLVDENTLLYAKEVLTNKGFAVSGAVTTTHFSNRTKYNEYPSASTCYTDRRGNEKMAEIFRYTAGMFNEIIIDDWYFTVCKCSNCIKMRHNKSWQEFRSELLFETAKKNIITPAKETRKDVKLILKLPNWMEAYYDRGYDLTKLAPLFDEIAVGVETRDFNKSRYMPVYGAMLYRYIHEISGDRVKKAWLDAYMCDEKTYPEQAYQAALAGAEEIILFCSGNLPLPKVRPLVEALIKNTPKIDSAAEHKTVFSIPIIRALNTYGDEKIHQYFLMLGAPAFITPNLKTQSKGVILTEQSAEKGEFEKVFTFLLKQKKDIFMTVNFAAHINKKFEIKKLDKAVKIKTIDIKKKSYGVEDNIFINQTINKGKNIILLDNQYPLLAQFKIKSSNVWILNLPYTTDTILNITKGEVPADYRHLLHLPKQAKKIFRSIFKKLGKANNYEKIKTLFKYSI